MSKLLGPVAQHFTHINVGPGGLVHHGPLSCKGSPPTWVALGGGSPPKIQFRSKPGTIVAAL